MFVPVVCFNPVILILFNESTERWHPILYWECPPPSANLGDCLRWKSKGHHTSGFPTKEEAISGDEGVLDLCRRQKDALVGGSVYYDTEIELAWDGADIPSDVARFELSRLTKYE